MVQSAPQPFLGAVGTGRAALVVTGRRRPALGTLPLDVDSQPVVVPRLPSGSAQDRIRLSALGARFERTPAERPERHAHHVRQPRQSIHVLSETWMERRDLDFVVSVMRHHSCLVRGVPFSSSVAEQAFEQPGLATVHRRAFRGDTRIRPRFRQHQHRVAVVHVTVHQASACEPVLRGA